MLKNIMLLTAGLVTLVAYSAHGAITETGDVIWNASGTTSDTMWRIGNTGIGSVTIDGGSSRAEVYVRVGNLSGAVGTLNVTGAGSSLLNNTNIMDVGNEAGAQGTINVTDGGQIVSAELTRIGYKGKGTVNLSGAGSTMVAGRSDRNTMVGDRGNSEGILNINQGASFEALRYAYVGRLNNATGTINVTDGGSLSTARHLYVAYFGNTRGTLNVDNGVVDIGTSGYDLYMGYDNQAEGTANIYNGSTVTIADDLYMGWGATNGSNNNKATMNITGAGTTVSVGDRVRLGYGERGPTQTLLSVGRGAVMTALSDMPAHHSSESGGFVVAYDTQDSATLEFIIGDDGNGTVASGLINAGAFSFGTGAATFDLVLDSGTSLSLGDMFTLVDYNTWDGNLFANVADDGLFGAGGYQFLINYNDDLGGGDMALTATVVIPEPATMTLLALGGLTLLGRKRKA